ncbi:hypothetical protein [Nonomuraea zeae]|uniref:Uncharacterized protein n=1 Tax=Nonomuraea zeae TaxID=1642303 RepID=A0A5S4GSA6_9ACTN|nr:hypothetical protein [Nonomuraea zeae]TMR29280.1 hypothetical protein ETD85_32820 [Nonomuraea zeae]
MKEILPVAGATKSSRCPKIRLTSDDGLLTATDQASGHSVRVRPDRLYHYSHDVDADQKRKSHAVQGVAALGADGLVLLDLPGDWHAPHLREFSQAAGIPLVDARDRPSAEVRAVLAGRAPGWQRLRGLPLPSQAKWRKPVAICAGVAGLGLMVYLGTLGMWGAWRGLSSLGRMLVDVLEAKWLMVAFSPALLVIRPVLARMHRRRTKRGTVLGPPGGPYLNQRSHNKLYITAGNTDIAKLRLGESPGQAFSLLLYRYEDLTGLFILDRFGKALHHLPGSWSAEDAHRFAERHGLVLAAHRVSREEYLDLTKATPEATP